ncbi:nuclear transport factor 2 family protein [Hymenobacter sp.]|uniref:YybH family protein n=1 Tax=Hymenobacter sp. TaxID=1898978 RepID=UPI00286D4A69|nr:nuclear transport factor 2 family protein [Hymenobacter sp.]
MKKQLVVLMSFLGLSCGAVGGCAGTRPTAQTDPGAARNAIVQLLTTQTAAWNRGDIPGFMESYWKSDSLVFIGRKGPTYGWQATLANYQKNYPNAAAMGQLDFSGLRVTLVAPGAAQAVGRWHLTRPVAGDLGGHFLLVLRQIEGKWVVAADHTNSE